MIKGPGEDRDGTFDGAGENPVLHDFDFVREQFLTLDPTFDIQKSLEAHLRRQQRWGFVDEAGAALLLQQFEGAKVSGRYLVEGLQALSQKRNMTPLFDDGSTSFIQKIEILKSLGMPCLPWSCDTIRSFPAATVAKVQPRSLLIDELDISNLRYTLEQRGADSYRSLPKGAAWLEPNHWIDLFLRGLEKDVQKFYDRVDFSEVTDTQFREAVIAELTTREKAPLHLHPLDAETVTCFPHCADNRGNTLGLRWDSDERSIHALRIPFDYTRKFIGPRRVIV